MNQSSQPHFWRNHLTIPLVIFLAVAASVELLGIDQLLTDIVYRLEGGSWTLKNAWVTSVLIHVAGKYFSLLLALGILIALLQSFVTQKLVSIRRELTYLICAAGGGSAIVSGLKSISHVSCAWDFARYGGSREYATVLYEVIHKSGGGDCFPAGHASGGYAWIALYFLGVHLNSGWRWAGLGFALAIGLIFGISQQLRGAHLISHDLWTLGICWFFSLAIYALILRKK